MLDYLPNRFRVMVDDMDLCSIEVGLVRSDRLALCDWIDLNVDSIYIGDLEDYSPKSGGDCVKAWNE